MVNVIWIIIYLSSLTSTLTLLPGSPLSPLLSRLAAADPLLLPGIVALARVCRLV
jgi:hypothetical protein